MPFVHKSWFRSLAVGSSPVITLSSLFLSLLPNSLSVPLPLLPSLPLPLSPSLQKRDHALTRLKSTIEMLVKVSEGAPVRGGQEGEAGDTGGGLSALQDLRMGSS